MTLGVSCVEHLKECTREEWADLFADQTVITKRVSARVFSALKEEGPFDPKKCAHQLGIRESSSSTPPINFLGKRGKDKDNGTTHSLMSKGFSVKMIPKATKKRMRLATFAAARSAVTDLIDDLDEAGDNELESAVGTVDSGDDESVVTFATCHEEEEISEDEEEEDHVADSGNTWTRSLRAGRCQLSPDLIDPATPEERITWDPDLVEASDRCDDLEDPDGFYKSLGCSKMSSDHKIAQEYAVIRKTFRAMAMKCHPDRTKDKRRHAKFSRRSPAWNTAEQAFKVLGTADDCGCFASRVRYDLDGERRRKDMEQVRLLGILICFYVLIRTGPLTQWFMLLQAINAVYHVNTI